MAHDFLVGLRELRRPRHAAVIVAITYAAWATQTGLYWSLGEAFDLGLKLPAYAVLMLAQNVVRSLPLTPGDIGAFEVTVTELAVVLGAGASPAAAFAIGAHLLSIAWTVLLGVGAAGLLGLDWSDLRAPRQAEEPREEPGSRA